MIDVVVGLLAVAGGAFAVIAALGLVRLPDVLIRMHAATKVGTLSAGLVMAAVALHESEAAVTVRAVSIVLFMFLTAPIAAHMIGRAALRMGVPLFRTDTTAFRSADERTPQLMTPRDSQSDAKADETYQPSGAPLP